MLAFDSSSSMFPATISLTDVTSSLCITGDQDQDKFSPGHVIVRQPYSVQIIQLVEEAAPPPRLASSDGSMASASTSNGTGSYWSSSYYSESACSEDDEDDDDEEGCDEESYCSSDEALDEDVAMEELHQESGDSSAVAMDTYSVRMKRILAWREDFYAQVGASLSESSLPNLKRKMDDDSVSHSSKRSRRSGSSGTTVSSLGMHSCPACDAFFDTQQSLRQHGLDAESKNEACSAAVEYEFE